MPTRNPKCVDCGGLIEPKRDSYHITNIEEAKYGHGALYAHDECPVADTDASDGGFDTELDDVSVAASAGEIESAGSERFVGEGS